MVRVSTLSWRKNKRKKEKKRDPLIVVDSLQRRPLLLLCDCHASLTLVSSNTFSWVVSSMNTWSYWKSFTPRCDVTCMEYSSGDLTTEKLPWKSVKDRLNFSTFSHRMNCTCTIQTDLRVLEISFIHTFFFLESTLHSEILIDLTQKTLLQHSSWFHNNKIKNIKKRKKKNDIFLKSTQYQPVNPTHSAWLFHNFYATLEENILSL